MWKRYKKRENEVIKDIKNLFNLKKEINDNTSVRNCFRLKKENKVAKDRIISDITDRFDQKKRVVINQ